jgi:hypothetical protein
MKLLALDRPGVPPLEMPERFRTEIVYFMTPADSAGAPPLGTDEYFVRLDEAKQWLDELVVYVVSPLDAEAKAEIELSEDHERFLQWLVDHGVQHVRLAR